MGPVLRLGGYHVGMSQEHERWLVAAGQPCEDVASLGRGFDEEGIKALLPQYSF